MSKVTGGLAQAICGKSGRSLTAAVSLVIMTTTAIVLLRLFREIEFNQLIAALERQSLGRLTTAGVFVVAGYLMLTCYDVFALRAIGYKTIPYRVAALASF